MSDLDKNSLDVKANLEQQINEIELLQSVYSKPGEFKIDDKDAFTLAEAFVSGNSPSCPNYLSYTVHLSVDDEEDEDHVTIDICCRTQSVYPVELPEVHVKSDQFTRSSQDKLNQELLTFMKTQTVVGEVCVYSVIEWLKGEVFNYCTPLTSPPLMSTKQTGATESKDSVQYCRMWLYMHHIYSKIKRRNILSLSKDYNLTGFCLPGKPGVVCVEGSVSNTNEFYGLLRRWNWKSITCRYREVGESATSSCVGASGIDSQRRFDGFQELAFDVHGPRGNHLDLGQFRLYLSRHNLDYMFKELFGVEGK